MGCLARMPLPHNAFRPIHHTSQPAAASSQPQQSLDRTSSRFASELWAPYLRDTALRVFGSVGVTGQLGHFCRPVLDFTAGQHCTCLSFTSPAWLVACYRHGCNAQGCYVMTVLLGIAPLSIVFRSSAGGVFVHTCKPCPSTSLGCAANAATVLASRSLTSPLMA